MSTADDATNRLVFLLDATAEQRTKAYRERYLKGTEPPDCTGSLDASVACRQTIV
ncbi:hypothetical protein [Streptomyces sp. NPDC001970]